MSADREHLERFRAGDRGAGEVLVDRYYQRVLGFFRNKAPASANDLAQQTFVECFTGLDRLRDLDRFRSFLFAIACNQLRKHYRGKRSENDRLDFGSVSAIDLDPSPSRVLVGRQEQRLLLEGLRRIPVDYQVVLELFYWEDMGAAEIAEVLELPIGTAKTRIRRGRQLLVEAMAAIEGASEALEQTIQDLDGWARQLQGKVGAAR